MNPEDISSNQKLFFDQHPFPGIGFDPDVNPAQFSHALEKNHLYRMIRSLVTPSTSLIDVGCGTGEFTNYLALESQAQVVGMDYSQASLNWGEGIKRNLKITNCNFIHHDVFDLAPEFHQKFDIALAMGLFPSIPQQTVAMKNIALTLKPGGTAIFGFFDPIARCYVRLKRWLVQSLASDFDGQKNVCEKYLCAHLTDEMEKKWVLNQITEEYLVYHSPRVAANMMRKCGLNVTDCFPRLSLSGSTVASSLNTQNGKFSLPKLQLLAQINWLFSSTSGYFVMVGQRQTEASSR